MLPRIFASKTNSPADAESAASDAAPAPMDTATRQAEPVAVRPPALVPASNLLDELQADEAFQQQREAIRSAARIASEAQARLDATRAQARAEAQTEALARARRQAEDRAAAQSQAHVRAQSQAHVRAQSQTRAGPPAPPLANGTPAQQLDLLTAQLEAMRNKVRVPAEPAVPATPPREPAAPAPPAPPRTAGPRGPGGPSGPGVSATGGTSVWAALSFDSIVRAVLRGWKIVALFALTGAGLAAIYAISQPNQYLSMAELLIEPRGVRVLNDSVTPNGLNSEATVAYAQSQVRIIASSAVIEPVIEELDLISDPEFNGEAPTGFQKVLARLTGFSGDNETTAAERAEAVRDTLYESFFVDRIAQTFNIQIGVHTQDPDKSARIANAIARTYIRDESSSNSRAARGANESLEARASILRAKVEEAERAVQDHRQRHDLVAAEGKLTSDVQIARMNEQLALAQVQTGDARTRAQAAEAASPADALSGSLPSSISSGAVDQLRVDYNRAKARLRRLESKLGVRHPKLLEAVADVAAAREAVEDEVVRLVRSVKDDYARALAREEELRSQLNVMKASSASGSDARVRLRELEATLEANREIYRTVLNRLRQTGEQENIRTQSTRLLSEALPASEKTGPNRKAMVMTGGIAGAIIGALLALLPLLLGIGKTLLKGGSGAPRPMVRNAPPVSTGDDDLYAVAPSVAASAPEPEPESEPTPKNPPAPTPQSVPVTGPAQAPESLPLFQTGPGVPVTSGAAPKPEAKPKRKKRRKAAKTARAEAAPLQSQSAPSTPAQMPLPHMAPPPMQGHYPPFTHPAPPHYPHPPVHPTYVPPYYPAPQMAPHMPAPYGYAPHGAYPYPAPSAPPPTQPGSAPGGSGNEDG